MSIMKTDHFGTFVDPRTGQQQPIKRFTWENGNNVCVQLITYGATITSIKFPDKDGAIDDVVLGFNNIDGYYQSNNPYFGATIGRVANRIGNGRFSIDGQVFNISKNHGTLTLHGGFRGFDKVNWNDTIEGNCVTLSYKSIDGEEGFPGDVTVTVRFELKTDEFVIQYNATTTKPTYINLTNHSYFNLAGHNAGADEIYNHVITIDADNITETDSNSIPTGHFIPVENTMFDLRTPKLLGQFINNTDLPGFDHNFCLNNGAASLSFAARAVHPRSKRSLEVYTTQPGVQFYTANFLPENPKYNKGNLNEAVPLVGKSGPYYKHGAFCFETQNYPDAINHANFPNAVTRPGETYCHTTIFKFSTQK